MVKTLLSILVLASVIVNCLAIKCYYRTSSTTSTNGTLIATCTATDAKCYSYISNSTYYGGCSTGSCSTASCTTCDTDYCNTLTPSAISCYTRSSVNSTDNGTMTLCPTGISSCYTQFSNGEAGCGICTSTYTVYYGCSTCNTSYCNTLTPSSISCYTRTPNPTSASSSNGYVSTCPTAVSSCYTHNLDGEAGCGTCTASATSRYSCTSCSSNNCNAATTLTFGCYTRTSTTASTSNGTTSACNSGVSTCYTYYSDGQAGCGTCSTSDVSNYGCTSCSSRFCNYRPNPLNCYSASASYLFGDKTNVACSSATSCYIYSFGSFYYAGCGSCSSSSYSSCRNCYTDYCNSKTDSAATIAGLNVKTVVASAATLLALMKLL